VLALLMLVAPASSGAQADEEDDRLVCRVDLVRPLLCNQTPPPPPPPPPQESGGSTGGAEPPPPGAPPVPAVTGARRGAEPPRVSERPQYVANSLLVEFERGTTKRQIAEVLERAGVSVDETIVELGIRVVSVPPARRDKALARLRASRYVASAERDVVIRRLDTRPNDSVWPEQWGLRLMGLPAAWDLTKGSSNVIVGVLDSGVDHGHPDLAGTILPGLDLVNGDGDPADDYGHGTSVAGIVAARTNNELGQAGSCWTCSILPIKVLDARGVGAMATLAIGLVEAVDRGARVINMSLGGPQGTETLEQAVAYALAKGAILVAAAGNNGTSTPFYPAAYPGVIGVAGTDETDALFPWSNHGPWVRLAAPGCNVATVIGGAHDHVCGTSTAAPLVAGVIALALAGKPTASRTQIEQALLQTAAATGAGLPRVDALKMLTALGIASPPATPRPAGVTTSSLRGKLTARGLTRAFPIVAGPGRLTASVTFTGKKKRLTLSVLDSAGALLARATGRSPLRVIGQVPAGPLRVVVSSRSSLSFALRLSYSTGPAG
jgi:subtilisin family serine protease